MKKTILAAFIAFTMVSFASCDKKAEKFEGGAEGHVHAEGEPSHEIDSTAKSEDNHQHSEGESHAGHDAEVK